MTVWQAFGVGILMSCVAFVTGLGLASAAVQSELEDRFREVRRMENAVDFVRAAAAADAKAWREQRERADLDRAQQENVVRDLSGKAWN